jgi:hypothetical protein
MMGYYLGIFEPVRNTYRAKTTPQLGKRPIAVSTETQKTSRAGNSLVRALLNSGHNLNQQCVSI